MRVMCPCVGCGLPMIRWYMKPVFAPVYLSRPFSLASSLTSFSPLPRIPIGSRQTWDHTAALCHLRGSPLLCQDPARKGWYSLLSVLSCMHIHTRAHREESWRPSHISAYWCVRGSMWAMTADEVTSSDKRLFTRVLWRLHWNVRTASHTTVAVHLFCFVF